ncbi:MULTISPECIES: ATP-grasp domain-containing protein [unclassified Streptomyces]|uniref:ATP-grasp domain-containing protein n=1 Tax=unclassified Streptomyces TaxID=2593676 RepID=UPI000DAE473E|nr:MULTISPECIES: ATP-grasp domain-containing protein [unclassified Streptomyces]PZT71871.1 carboxylate--amine ligase [Streptomyces sp. AC1-42T]PZT81800.1 carboxylate--amine ligase [Streptomyces sp. AC1-42W]
MPLDETPAETAAPASPTVLVLGGTAPVRAADGRDISERSMRQFRARGCRIVLTDTAAALSACPELADAADEAHPLDFTDPAACVEWATAYAAHHPVDAVVGFREYAVVAVAETAAALGLRGNAPAAVRRVRSKDACREFLRAAGFTQPGLRLCSEPAEAAAFLASRGGAPVIVKPRDRCNSEGVSLVTEEDQLASAFEAARDDEGLVLVESYVEGPEYSVEGLFTGGRPTVLAVTEKQLSAGSFVESGHTVPAPLPEALRQEIADEVVRALTALGLTTGPFHVECWLTGQGVVLGEVHVRQGGDGIHALLEWCHPGFELYGSWLDDLLGRPAELPGAPRRGAAVRFLVPPPGTVERVSGWDAVAAHPSVLAAASTLAAGDEVGTGASNSDRHGMIIVGTERPHEAAPLADSLIASIDVRVS